MLLWWQSFTAAALYFHRKKTIQTYSGNNNQGFFSTNDKLSTLKTIGINLSCASKSCPNFWPCCTARPRMHQPAIFVCVSRDSRAFYRKACRKCIGNMTSSWNDGCCSPLSCCWVWRSSRGCLQKWKMRKGKSSRKNVLFPVAEKWGKLPSSIDSTFMHSLPASTSTSLPRWPWARWRIYWV